MKEFKYVVMDELGLHARPAGLLVKEAAKFKSAITLDSGARRQTLRESWLLCPWALRRA